MDFELPKKRVVKFNYEGTALEVQEPTVKQQIEYEQEIKKEGADQTQLLFDFLEKLGLPRKIGMDMTLQQVELILSKITPSKKN